jgi:hypothetical protein
MKERIDFLFSLFDKHSIRYYLLRPIDFQEAIKDIDFVLCHDDYSKLKKILINSGMILKYKPPNANSSIQLLADGLLLDIKFDICFLPRKSLVIQKEAPYASVKYISDHILVPDVSEEKLFTFWTFHLFLDKDTPKESSTFDVYKNLYQKTWQNYLASNFFNNWTITIFNEHKSKSVKKLLENYFIDGLKSEEVEVNRELKSLVLENDMQLKLKYFFDKIKFGVYRRLGRYEDYRAVK